jgi:hypothetical protein
MDAALPLPQHVVEREGHLEPSKLGLAIGASVPALVASGAWWMDLPWVAAIAAPGTLVGGLIGALMGRRVIDRGWAGTSILSAIVAPLVPAAVISVVFLVTGSGSTVAGSQQSLLSWLAVSAALACYAELFALPITLPIAIVIALLVRRAYRMPRRRARMHVGLLVTVAVVAGTTTVLGVLGLLAPLGIDGVFDLRY